LLNSHRTPHAQPAAFSVATDFLPPTPDEDGFFVSPANHNELEPEVFLCQGLIRRSGSSSICMSSVPLASSATGSPLVFKAHGRSFSQEQTLQAAEFRGELEPLRSQWRRDFDRVSLVNTSQAATDRTEVQQLQDEYRYRRNLTTAEECEEWLAARGITVEEFRAHFVRRYWAGKLVAESEHESSLVIDADARLARAFRTDVVLSNEFDRLARKLAWRAAISPAGDGHQAFPPKIDESATGAPEPGAQSELRDNGAWRRELEHMEAGFQRECRQVLTADRRRLGLASMRPYLLRLELDILELDSEAAAREAFLCVQQDGISLSELATEQGYSLQQQTPLLEELPNQSQPAFLGASPGTVLPPTRIGRGFRVVQIKSKAEPGLSDPGVQLRVDAGIIRCHFLELELRHVRWHMPIEETA
jgi:hypothetical protein